MKLSKSLHHVASAILVSATAIAFAGLAHAIEPANGTLIVAHESNPDDIQDFIYMVDGQTPGGADLNDDATAAGGDSSRIKMKTFSVTPGDYTISQINPTPGWTLTGIQCDGPSPTSVNLRNRSVTLNVASGTNITCKFLNERATAPATGKVIIQKQVNPTHAQDFYFQGTGPSNWNQPFQLDDDIGASGTNNLLPKSRAFDVPPGSYKFAEIPTNGWSLTKIECSPVVNASVNLNGHSAQINVVAGQTTTCYFTNTQNNAEIRIIKDAMPNSLKDFGFTGGGPNFAQAFILDDDAGVTNADNQRQSSQAFIVPAGQYVFTEALASPWVLTGITCTPGGAAVVDLANRKATITVGAGQSVTCTYNNKPAAPLPCLDHSLPLSATVNFFAPGWNVVNICRGGTVTFNKAPGISFTVTPSSPPASFTPIPMGVGAATGTTGPFANTGTTPITYKYWSAAAAGQGSIIVW